MSRVTLPVTVPRQSVARDQRDHISFSSISLFQSCSLRYFFRYVEHLPEPTVAASLLLGTGLHAGIEYHFRELLVGNVPPSLDTLLDVFWSAWHERDAKVIVFGKGDDINTIGRLAERMFRAFQVSSFAKPRGTIIGARTRRLPRPGDRCGREDRERRGRPGRVILLPLTFKSTRSSWNQDHVGDAASQLLLYHELVKPLVDGKPVRLEDRGSRTRREEA